jgi:hypothetical protein
MLFKRAKRHVIFNINEVIPKNLKPKGWTKTKLLENYTPILDSGYKIIYNLV